LDTYEDAVQSPSSTGEPLLEVRGLTAGYGGRAVIYDVDLKLHRGEVVVLLGSNGAGKTTTLKSIVGLVRPLAASARFDGMKWRMDRPWRAAQSGISFIPAERATFAALSVADNLALGSYTIRSPEDRERRMGQVLELFPRLGERLTQKAGTMSGGEQRMLSIGIALMAEPKLLLLDEPSLGLAPVIVEQIMTTIAELSARGMSVLMVEQNVGQAVRVADRTYVMRSGGMILEEPAAQTRARDDWWDLF
jgi:branched-chain amino acid transport system ATP-binding protein